MEIASRKEVKKGEKLVSVGDVNDHLYFVQSGLFSVELSGEQMADINSGSFAGHMSFKEWSGKHEALLRAKATLESSSISTQYRQWVTGGHSPIFPASTSIESENMIHVRVDHVGDTFELIESPSLVKSPSSSSSVTMTMAETPHHHQKKESTSKEQYGKANVTAREDCIVYSWSFKKLYEAMIESPRLGFVLEQLLSQDLNLKLSQTWTNNISGGGKISKYKSVLTGALLTGEVSLAEKVALEQFRIEHSITKEEHQTLLSALGWSSNDYDVGQKGGSKLLDDYQNLLKEMTGNELPLTTESKKKARAYRQENRIGFNLHLTALQRIGWNEDDWEEGEKLKTKQQDQHRDASSAFNPLQGLKSLLLGSGGRKTQ
jgi:CRP-like cAMP-binding protein